MQYWNVHLWIECIFGMTVMYMLFYEQAHTNVNNGYSKCKNVFAWYIVDWILVQLHTAHAKHCIAELCQRCDFRDVHKHIMIEDWSLYFRFDFIINDKIAQRNLEFNEIGNQLCPTTNHSFCFLAMYTSTFDTSVNDSGWQYFFFFIFFFHWCLCRM